MRDVDKKDFYIEDDFDLSEFKLKFLKSKILKEQIRRNKRIARLLLIPIAVMIFLCIFFISRDINYYTEMKKSSLSKSIAQDIILESVEQESNYVEVTEALDVLDGNSESVSVSETFLGDAGDSTDETDGFESRVELERIVRLRETFSNEDIVAYLAIEGTNINYAVAQYVDNDFYLTHDLYGEKNAAGSIFMDYECDPNMLSRNTVIYGHNMRNGTKFHNLRNFKNFDFFEQHRFISLTTLYEDTTWEIFSFYETKTDFYYIQVIFPDDASFEELIYEMKEKSLYDTGVEVGVDDKILTLSTCAGYADDVRLVINARLVEF